MHKWTWLSKKARVSITCKEQRRLLTFVTLYRECYLWGLDQGQIRQAMRKYCFSRLLLGQELVQLVLNSNHHEQWALICELFLYTRACSLLRVKAPAMCSTHLWRNSSRIALVLADQPVARAALRSWAATTLVVIRSYLDPSRTTSAVDGVWAIYARVS